MRIIVSAIIILTWLWYPKAIFANGVVHFRIANNTKHWKAPLDAAKRINSVPATAESVKRGKYLFQAHCTVCHGPYGRGNGPAAAGLNPKPPDLVKMAGHHTDGDIAWKIENGRGAMPAWKGRLEEKDIWHLTNFIQALSSELPSR